MAPEAFKGKVSRKVDVYAFGMVLYEIATGLPPYSSGKATDLVRTFYTIFAYSFSY
eukprot:m.169513 g.169513  ORF g.169513 m.169513 type:complete len:56 (+) comp39002_c0_seq3:2154-2321(+)